MEWPTPIELNSLSPQLVWLRYVYVERPLTHANIWQVFGRILICMAQNCNGDLLIIYKFMPTEHCGNFSSMFGGDNEHVLFFFVCVLFY